MLDVAGRGSAPKDDQRPTPRALVGWALGPKSRDSSPARGKISRTSEIWYGAKSSSRRPLFVCLACLESKSHHGCRELVNFLTLRNWCVVIKTCQLAAHTSRDSAAKSATCCSSAKRRLELPWICSTYCESEGMKRPNAALSKNSVLILGIHGHNIPVQVTADDDDDDDAFPQNSAHLYLLTPTANGDPLYRCVCVCVFTTPLTNPCLYS